MSKPHDLSLQEYYVGIDTSRKPVSLLVAVRDENSDSLAIRTVIEAEFYTLREFSNFWLQKFPAPATVRVAVPEVPADPLKVRKWLRRNSVPMEPFRIDYSHRSFRLALCQMTGSLTSRTR